MDVTKEEAEKGGKEEEEEEVKRPSHLPSIGEKTLKSASPKSAPLPSRASDSEVGLGGGDPVRLLSKDPRSPEGRE